MKGISSEVERYRHMLWTLKGKACMEGMKVVRADRRQRLGGLQQQQPIVHKFAPLVETSH
jgi:hypothetical protein